MLHAILTGKISNRRIISNSSYGAEILTCSDADDIYFYIKNPPDQSSWIRALGMHSMWSQEVFSTPFPPYMMENSTA